MDTPPPSRPVNLHCVILAGGSGTRLWPLSRQALPKQFAPVFERESLFEQTLKRCASLRELGNVKLHVVGHVDHRFLIAEQLESFQAEDTKVQADVWLEPISRGTAASVSLALQDLPGHDWVLVCPSDHFIPAVHDFTRSIEQALRASDPAKLLLFGVIPTHPSSAYGYMVHAQPEPGLPSESVRRIERFVEKPAPAQAQELLRAGGAWWNSGMVFSSVRALREEFVQHAMPVATAMRSAFQSCEVLDDFFQRNTAARFRQAGAAGFQQCPTISVDHAVLERSRNVVAQALLCSWSDVGSWSAFSDLLPADAQGNRVEGRGVLREASNTYVRAPHRPVVALGTQDLIIVDTPDALLVAHRDREQEIRHAVEDLRSQGVFEATAHRKSNRPWGWYDVIDRADRFVVKRIGVKPGASLSLQMHYHRAEHWVVVQGTAEVTCDDEVLLLSENQSTYIPVGAVHRLRNPGKIELQVLEVQTGSYLQENDIVRLQDRYGRKQPSRA